MESKKITVETPAFPSRRPQPKCLVCPDDYSIPKIFIDLREEKLNIEIQCDQNQHHKKKISYKEYCKILDEKKISLKEQKCSLIEPHKESKAEGYCIICKKWVCQLCLKIHDSISQKDKGFNHSIIKEDAIMMNVNSFCKEDGSSNNYWYCLSCCESGCKKCITSDEHSNHQIIDTTETFSSKEANNGIKKCQDFEMKYFAQLLENKTKGIQMINKWYDYNLRINSDLFDYVNNQLYMYRLLKETNNYNGGCNLKDISAHINFKMCDYDEEGSVEENSKNIMHFFQNNGIFEKENKPFKCTRTVIHEGQVWSLCKLSNKEYAVGFHNGDIKIIDFLTSTVQRVGKGHTLGVWKGYLHTKKNYLISLSFDKSVGIWNHSNGERIQVLQGHTECVSSIVEQGNNIITSSNDRSIKIWDIDSFKCSKTIADAHSDCVFIVCIGKDKRGISGGKDKHLKVWKDNLNTKEDVIISIPHSSWVCSLLQGKDQRLVVGTENDIMIYDVTKDFKQIGELKSHRQPVCILTELFNGFVASGSHDSKIIIWDGRKYQCEQVLTENCGLIYKGGIEWEQEVIIMGGLNGTVKIGEAK